MSYLTRDMCFDALRRMCSFHDGLVNLYHSHEMSLLDNLGRRNIVMSQAQEKYFADVLSVRWQHVRNNGKTGQPDIIIGSLDRELECKLTSRNRCGGIQLQADLESLKKKGSLDFLYVIAGYDFKSFTVLHFEGLTSDDFRSLSPGSRGKVSMRKSVAMKKCHVLVGGVTCLNLQHIEKLKLRLEHAKTDKQTSLLHKKIKYWEDVDSKYRIELEEVV